MTAVALVQARMSSTRLPGKVLMDICGRPVLRRVVDRVRRAPGIAAVVVVTTTEPGDEAIRSYCREEGIPCFAGSEHDVLDRYHRAAVAYEADPVVRITADCPLVDPAVVGRLLDLYGSRSYDYVGVAAGAGAIHLDSGRFPDGLDAECFSFEALVRASHAATAPPDREHVTPYIWRNRGLFRVGTLFAEGDWGHLRVTLDTEADLELVRRIYGALADPSLEQVLAYLDENPDAVELNAHHAHPAGYRDLWSAA